MLPGQLLHIEEFQLSDIVFEPFRIKVVEPIEISGADDRRSWLEEAGYNVFNLPARRVMIDLLTDSGTSAMSNHQWSALQSGDESYAGSESFYELEACAQDLFCKRFIIPVHQGRAGEHLLFSTLLKAGDIVPSNGHFDTTAANIEDNQARALSLPVPEAKDLHTYHSFKGNIHLEALENLLNKQSAQIPFVMISVTNNTGGGQPVSFENIQAVKKLCEKHGKNLVLDACRFAENAAFIQQREKGFANEPAKEIAQKIFRLADSITFSGKKDAFSNIGGLVCLDDEVLAEKLKNRLIVTEGFATYGGLAGRDLAAMAQGLREITDESYLAYRLRTVEWMVERLRAKNVPVLFPAGGHGVYLDAAAFFPHIKPEHLPGITLINELYCRGGIRGVELGNVAFGTRNDDGTQSFPDLDLVRLALPRRVYTEAHMGYVVENVIALFQSRDSCRGYEFETEAPVMRHFRSSFKPRKVS